VAYPPPDSRNGFAQWPQRFEKRAFWKSLEKDGWMATIIQHLSISFRRRNSYLNISHTLGQKSKVEGRTRKEGAGGTSVAPATGWPAKAAMLL